MLVFILIHVSFMLAENYTIGYGQFERIQVQDGFYARKNESIEIIAQGGFERYTVSSVSSVHRVPLSMEEWRHYKTGDFKYSEQGTTLIFSDGIQSTDKIISKYHKVGTYKGRLVGLKLEFGNFVVTDDMDPRLGYGAKPLIQLASNARDGYATWNIKSFNINQSFFYEDTGETANFDYLYMQFGSMNRGEGVTPYFSADTYRVSDTTVGLVGSTWEGLNENFVDSSFDPTFFRASVVLKTRGSSVSYKVSQKSIKNIPASEATSDKIGKGFNSDFWNTLSFSPMVATAPPPVKTVKDGTNWVTEKQITAVGESVDYRVSQDVEIYGYNGSFRYSSFVFEDVLPSEVDYKSVELLENSSTVASSNYTASYDSNTRKVTVSLTSSFLNNMPLSGETYHLVIHTKANATAFTKTSFDNKGSTTICNSKAETNVVTVKPVTYTVTTEVINGTIDPTVTGILPSTNIQINYLPNDGYYVESVEVNGTLLSLSELADHLSSYSFTDIQDNHKIKVVCKPIPSLTIRKEYSGERRDFGSTVFLFKVAGQDRFGNNLTWCKRINGNGSVTFKVPAGTYLVEEYIRDRYIKTEIIGITNCDSSGSCSTLTGNAEVKFKNLLNKYEDYGHNDDKVNNLK